VPVAYFTLPPEAREVGGEEVHVTFARHPETASGEELEELRKAPSRMALLVDGLALDPPAEFVDRVSAELSRAGLTYTPAHLSAGAEGADVNAAIFAGLREGAVRAQTSGGSATYLASLRKLGNSFQQVIAELEAMNDNSAAEDEQRPPANRPDREGDRS
jgi:hypothetical protein